MKEQIKDLTERYSNHLNCWKDSLRTYQNGLNKTPQSDRDQVVYWKAEIRNAETKIETYDRIITDLKSIISQQQSLVTPASQKEIMKTKEIKKRLEKLYSLRPFCSNREYAEIAELESQLEPTVEIEEIMEDEELIEVELEEKLHQ